jgi:lysophospholipase L1-like esterase
MIRHLLLVLVATALAAAEPVRGEPLDDWGEIHARMCADAKARAGRIQVVLVGDSITARWTTSPGEKEFAEHLAPLGAINLGIPADGTQHVLWRLQHGVLDGLHPKAVLVMIGTNNLTAGSDPESVLHGIWCIVDHLRRTLPGARVLVQGLFPRCDRPGMNEQVLRLNALLPALADGEAVQVLDFSARFLAADGSGKPDPAVFTDGIHPNLPPGFRIWREAVMPTVTAWIAAPALPSTPSKPSPVAAPKDLRPSTPEARNDWLNRHRGLLKTPAAAKSACKVLFLGDELMRAWDRSPELFKAEYAGYGALNFAIWGNRPRSLLWQIENGALDGLDPALVVVQGQGDLRRAGAEDCAAGMTAAVAALRQRLPRARILLLAAFPQGERPDDPRRALVADYNRRLAAIAAGSQGAVELLDLGASFLSPDGTLAKGAAPEITATVPAAWEQWAEGQRAAIRRLAER